MPKSPLIELTMSASVGYDAQPIVVNALNIGALHCYRRKVSHDPVEYKVCGTYVCVGNHDFIVDEDCATVIEMVRAVVDE